ncbi:transcriptional regulator [Kineococcus sp. NUM-3379]
MRDFAQQVSGVAALADPTRRQLYLLVAASPEPVSRDQAAEAAGIARHVAKFHLDKLAEEGLLVVEHRRLSGRSGPGAGRPTKLYSRSPHEVEVTLPERRYALAAQLMAQAIDTSSREGTPVLEALSAAATTTGEQLGAAAAPEAGGDAADAAEPVERTCRALAAQGFEPRLRGADITLANCPFHALAREHTRLVCSMNLALVAALARRTSGGRLAARLEPAPDRCCVVLGTEGP